MKLGWSLLFRENGREKIFQQQPPIKIKVKKRKKEKVF
jgi:hypothetical protein